MRPRIVGVVALLVTSIVSFALLAARGFDARKRGNLGAVRDSAETDLKGGNGSSMSVRAARERVQSEPSQLGRIVTLVSKAENRDPIPRAVVTAIVNGDQVRRAMSNGSGEAILEDVPEGEVTLRAATADRISSSTRVWLRNGESQVELAAFEATTFEFNVVDLASKAPISDAVVRVESFGRFADETTQSNGDGRCLLRAPANWPLRIVVDAQGFRRWSVDRLGGASASGVTEVRVEMAPRGYFRGIVLNPDGEPAADVPVWLDQLVADVRPASRASRTLDGWRIARRWVRCPEVESGAVTDAFGRFSIADVPFTAEARLTARTRDAVLTGSVCISGESARADTEITLRKECNVVVDLDAEAGELPADAYAVMDDGREQREAHWNMGHLVFPSATMGAATLVLANQERVIAAEPILLVEGVPVQLRVSVGVRLAGRVVDDLGQPVPSVPVHTSLHSVAGSPIAPITCGPTTSGVDGRFVFEGTAPGSYAVASQRTRLHQASRPVDVVHPSEDVVLVTPRSSLVQFRLASPGQIDSEPATEWRWTQATCVVRGNGSAGENLLAGREGREAVTMAFDAEGAADLVLGVAGFAPCVRPVVLVRGGVAEINGVLLNQGVSLAVRVVDEAGRGVADATVSVVDVGPLGAHGTTGADGIVTLHRVPADCPLGVRIRARTTAFVRLQPSDHSPLEVRLSRGGLTLVEVTDRGGRGVSEWVKIVARGGGQSDVEFDSRTSDDDGRFFIVLEPGEYLLRCANLSGEAEVVVRDREVVRVQIKVE